MAEFAQKRANSAIATLALCAKLCKAHTCNIFEQGQLNEVEKVQKFCSRILGLNRDLLSKMTSRIGRKSDLPKHM